jgi:membrane protein implicated in regulation of membrane protease activity
VILLVLVVLLWLAVLAPSVWRRFVDKQGVGSIDHFHHQLQLLEHAAPKTVTPAYRLHTALPGVESPAPTAAADSSRPKLMLLRPTDDQAAADVDDLDGCHYERVGVLDRPEPVCLPPPNGDLPAYRRERARRRCTLLLRCLVGVAISTALIGVVPRLHLAWVVTGLSGLAALALVGLMAYAREVEAQQTQQKVRRSERSGVRARGDGLDPDDPATAGHPGAWNDDEYWEPRAAAR